MPQDVVGVAQAHKVSSTPGRGRSECVCYSTGSHWILFAGPAAACAGSFLALCFILFVAPGWWILAFMPLVCSLVWAARLFPTYKSFCLTLEKERISVKSGVFGEEMLPLDLSGIRGLSVRQSEAGKMLGYGDVHLRHVHGYWVFRTIKDPAAFRRQLRNAVIAMRGDAEVDFGASQIVG